MQAKISLFSFLAAFIVVCAKILMEKADENGNIYIKTPRMYIKEIKNGFIKFKEFLKDRKSDR